MADLNPIRDLLQQAYDKLAVEMQTQTIAQIIAAKDAAEAAVAPLQAENAALKAKIEAQKIEADQVVAEAVDARAKLDG